MPYFIFDTHLKIAHNDLKLWVHTPLEEKFPFWIKQIHSFLQDWFSSSDTIVVQTSGTTKTPQQIIKKKKHLIFSAQETINFLKIPEYGKIILCLQAKYIAAQLMIIRALVGNLDLYCIQPIVHPLKYLQEKFPTEYFDLIALVPYQLQEHLQFLKNIKYTLIGGSNLPQKMKKELQNLPTNIFETFGMAETLTHIALKPISNPETGIRRDLFFTMPSIEITTTEKGILKIKSPKRGIPNFFQTKDVVKIHSSNSFSYLGRIDSIIKTGSLKIQPEVLEQKIQNKIQLLQNKEFFVDALLHPKLEHQLILIIEGDNIASQSTIKELCKKHLEFFEVPKKIFFLPKFLRSKNMKILREKTKKLAISNQNF